MKTVSLFKYYVIAEAEVEIEKDNFINEEIVLGPVDDTYYQLDVSSIAKLSENHNPKAAACSLSWSKRLKQARIKTKSGEQ